MKISFRMTCLVGMILGIALMGCSNELSRSKAKSILEKTPALLTAYIGDDGISRQFEKPNPAEILLEEGYFTRSQSNSVIGGFRYEPTEKLKAFLVPGETNKIIIAYLKPKEIEGIFKFSENECSVDYKPEMELTKIGRLLGINEYNRNINSNLKAEFQRYDEGWRLMKIGNSAIYLDF